MQHCCYCFKWEKPVELFFPSRGRLFFQINIQNATFSGFQNVKCVKPLTNYNFLNTFTIATFPYVTTAKAIAQLPQLNHSAMFSQSVLLAMQKWVEMSTPSVSKMIFSVHTAFRPSQVQRRMPYAATLYPDFWVIINKSHTSYNICF